jgi:hypothetical protein
VDDEVADIVQCGLCSRNAFKHSHLDDRADTHGRKALILLILRSWLAALDDFRNWSIREAA